MAESRDLASDHNPKRVGRQPGPLELSLFSEVVKSATIGGGTRARELSSSVSGVRSPSFVTFLSSPTNSSGGRVADSGARFLETIETGEQEDRDSYTALYSLERHRGVLEILLLLANETSVTKTRMRQVLRPGSNTIDSALKALVQLHLAQVTVVRKRPYAIFYGLTDKGRTVAMSVSNLQTSLSR